MQKEDIRLKDWPFDNGARVKLEWIGEPIREDKKVKLPTYFFGKIEGTYTTQRLMVDWGVLATLLVQHYYIDGILSKPLAPDKAEEITLTIFPNQVKYFEKNYTVWNTTFEEKSQTFVVKANGMTYYLPLIEVIRGILAPNAFLLNCLFEANSFPQYFWEQREYDILKLDFTSRYHRNYLNSEQLHHLTWLLVNTDVRSIYENMAANFQQYSSLEFAWSIDKPMTLKLNARKTNTGYIVINIQSVLQKRLMVSKLEISHPSFTQMKKSNEAKKRIQINISNKGDLTIDSEVDGRTLDFDEVATEGLTHEYIDSLLIDKRGNLSSNQRQGIDEHTKKQYKKDDNRRSMADIGGMDVIKGLEVKSVNDVYLQGDLAEFQRILNNLALSHFVHSVDSFVGCLTDLGDRTFAYLDDGVTSRKYIVAYVKMMTGQEVALLEVERAGRSLSMLILTKGSSVIYETNIEKVLRKLIYTNGNWASEILECVDIRIKVLKVKHTPNIFKNILSKIG